MLQRYPSNLASAPICMCANGILAHSLRVVVPHLPHDGTVKPLRRGFHRYPGPDTNQRYLQFPLIWACSGISVRGYQGVALRTTRQTLQTLGRPVLHVSPSAASLACQVNYQCIRVRVAMPRHLLAPSIFLPAPVAHAPSELCM